eukprot:458757-Pyramimonas_sp.AAC.1
MGEVALQLLVQLAHPALPLRERGRRMTEELAARRCILGLGGVVPTHAVVRRAGHIDIAVGQLRRLAWRRARVAPLGRPAIRRARAAGHNRLRWRPGPRRGGRSAARGPGPGPTLAPPLAHQRVQVRIERGPVVAIGVIHLVFHRPQVALLTGTTPGATRTIRV